MLGVIVGSVVLFWMFFFMEITLDMAKIAFTISSVVSILFILVRVEGTTNKLGVILLLPLNPFYLVFSSVLLVLTSIVTSIM